MCAVFGPVLNEKHEKLLGYVDTRGYLRCVHCIADGMGKYEDDAAVYERSSPHNVESCECCGMRLNDPNIEAGPADCGEYELGAGWHCRPECEKHNK